MIYSKITELIGNTPLVELTNLEKEENLDARVSQKWNSLIQPEALKIELP